MNEEEILGAFLLVNDYRILTNEELEDVKKLCHYTNLQLLKAKDNLDKKDSLEWELK